MLRRYQNSLGNCFEKFENFQLGISRKWLSSNDVHRGPTERHFAWQVNLKLFDKQCLLFWPGRCLSFCLFGPQSPLLFRV